MRRTILLLALVTLAVLLPATGCGLGGSAKEEPTGVSLLSSSPPLGRTTQLGSTTDVVFHLTFAVSTRTNAFALWARPLTSPSMDAHWVLVAERSGVAGQTVSMAWDTTGMRPDVYLLEVVTDVGERFVISEPLPVRS